LAAVDVLGAYTLHRFNTKAQLDGYQPISNVMSPLDSDAQTGRCRKPGSDRWASPRFDKSPDWPDRCTTP
jgi:hypothetical protein